MLHIDDSNHNFKEQTAIINKKIATLNNIIDTPPEPKRKIGFNRLIAWDAGDAQQQALIPIKSHQDADPKR